MTNTAKILTIYYKHKRGGFCKRIKLKIEAYLEKGWEVHYIAVLPYPYKRQNLKPHILPTPMSRHEGIVFWTYFFLAAPVYAFILAVKYRFALISSVSPIYAWICTPARMILKIPMVTFLLTKPKFTTDCHKPYQSLTSLELMMEKTGMNSSSLLIANSYACKEDWIRQFGKNFTGIEVHPNNIEAMTFDRAKQREKLLQEFSLASNSFIVATSSILEPHKNVEILIEAFLLNINPRAVLIIIGDGEQRNELTRLAEKLTPTGQIIFAGWREDVVAIFQGADMFALPSRREGMSEALLEAGACGIPCLVSAIPENMEVIRNPEQHFPVENPEILTEKINQAIEDPEFYALLQENTQQDIQRYIFDWKEKLTERVESLIRN